MPDAMNLAKAELRQLDSTFQNEIERGTWCTVQFNPESLKVTFNNQLVKPPGRRRSARFGRVPVRRLEYDQAGADAVVRRRLAAALRIGGG